MLSRRNLWPAGLLALLLLAATAVPAQILNSERIQAEFGSYGIEILHSERWLRLSNLYSIEGTERIMRTFAIVGFPEFVVEPLVADHRAVLGGASIGATFQASGWNVIKVNAFYDEYVVPGNMTGLTSRMQIAPDTQLAVHAYRFDLAKQDERYSYAWIIEMHHPAYLARDELESIYGSVAEPATEDVGLARRLMNDGLLRLQEIGLALGE